MSPDPPRWLCARCGANNMPTVGQCFRCQAGRPSPAAFQSQPTQVMPAPRPQQYLPPTPYSAQVPGIPEALAPPHVAAPQVVHSIQHEGYRHARMDGCAIASVVLGMLGLICFLWPWPWSFAGAIMAGVSLYRTANEPQLTGRGLAWGGLALSLIPFVLTAAIFFWAALQPTTPTPLYPPGNRPF